MLVVEVVEHFLELQELVEQVEVEQEVVKLMKVQLFLELE